MNNSASDSFDPVPRTPLGDRLAVVLGGNEVASAIAATLTHRGWGVALSHDPRSPVLRRAAAFYDTLFGDPVVLGGIAGQCATSSVEIDRILRRPNTVAVTALDPLDLLVCGPIGLLVDARFEDDAVKPDLRWLAGRSFGIGAGWYAGFNCDTAIPVPGGFSSERVVAAPHSGVWYTPIEAGTRVYRNMTLGRAGGRAGGAMLRAPCDGVVMGIVRDGVDVAAGQPLVSIDPRIRHSRKGSVDACGQIVAIKLLEAARISIRPRTRAL